MSGRIQIKWALFFLSQCPLVSIGQGLDVPTNLPILSVNTRGQEILDAPKIPADMVIIYNGPGKLNRATDSVYNFKGTIGIELRGSSTQAFDKKPYGFQIQDGSGTSIDISLLGMPKRDDWVLDASYDDKTLLRNELAYKLGRSMHRYASRTRYVEMLINGYDVGVYALQEKIKRDKYRVNIAKLDPTSVSDDGVTGGYIIKIDKTTGSGGEGWYSAYPPEGNGSAIFFQYDYPKAEDMVAAQKTYIQKYVASFEGALNGSNFADPVNGYRKYMDVRSLIDYFLMMEVTKNPDGYRLSTYISKQIDSKGGKLSMGPIWDFNEGFGNVNYCTQGNAEGFVLHFNSICPDDSYQIPFWWSKIFSDRAFVDSVATRWAALRKGPFNTDSLTNYVDSVATVLTANGAEKRNFNIWPVLGQYVWPNYYVGNSYTDELDWIKQWITDRMNWLDANLPKPVTTTGLSELPNYIISTFPNPFTQQITVEVNAPQAGDLQLELFDIMGRKLETRIQTYADPGTYENVFRLPQSPAGIYYFRANFNGAVNIIKTVKL